VLGTRDAAHLVASDAARHLIIPYDRYEMMTLLPKRENLPVMDISVVFVFIFVIIVVGFLLGGGVNLILKFFGAGEDVKIENQAKEFEYSVYSKEKNTGIFWTTTGSTETFDFATSDNVEKVCFFDQRDPKDNPAKGWIDEYDYNELIKTNNYTLVYFRKDKGIKGFYVEKLKPEENFCISTTTSLLLTNKGSYVDVKPA